MANTPTNDMISDDYRRQLQEKHATDSEWGNTGIRLYGTLLEMIDRTNAQSVLDYGCGKGLVGTRFREEQKQPGNKYAHVDFREYDPGIPGKDLADTSADVLFNTDVLEHIEPEFLDNVLADMARRTNKAAFMLISCVSAFHRLPDGRNAHLIIEHPVWWKEKINQYFTIVQAEAKGGEYYVFAAKKDPAHANDTPRKTTEADKALLRAQPLFDTEDYTKARLLLRNLKNEDHTAQTLFLLGRIAYETQDYVTAYNTLTEAVKRQRIPSAIRLLGICMAKLSLYGEALRWLEDPYSENNFMDDARYRATLMLCWNRVLKPERTIALYKNRTETDPECITNYIDAMILQSDIKNAVTEAEKAVEKFPGAAMLWAALSQAYDVNNRNAQSVEAARKSVALEPEKSAYHSNLGLALLHDGQLDESMAAFDRAIELEPLLAAAYLNRAGIYRQQGDYERAEKELRMALEIEPASGDIHYALGINLVRQQRYEEGFAHAEWFWHKMALNSQRVSVEKRRWFGEDLKGKTILVFADQGMGDMIMMMRYIKMIQDRGATVIGFDVEDKLGGFLEYQYADEIKSGAIRVLTKGKGPINDPFDFVVAISTLPMIFNTGIASVPAPEGFIRKRDAINYKTPEKPFVIGISWYTRSLMAGLQRSLALMDFAFLKKFENVRIVNLQYGDTKEERAKAKEQGFDIFHDESIDAWSSIQGSVDQIAACDLVISIDNTTVHTAGALGVPTWVLLPEDAYWRWPTKGESTPWYSSLRLFRPQDGQPYQSVVTRVEQALTQALAQNPKTIANPPAFKPAPVLPQTKRKALLINDTGAAYTWGNAAAMAGLKNSLADQGFEIDTVHTMELSWFTGRPITLQDFDDPVFLDHCWYRDPTLFQKMKYCDSVIINGEGLMNNASEPALQMMYLAYVAKQVFGRKVGIVNHSCFPEGGLNLSDPKRLAFYLKTYKLLDSCCVREASSQNLLGQIGINATLGFDTSVLWAKAYLDNRDMPSRTKRVILTAGPGYDNRASETFARLCKKLKQGGWQPTILNGARWHPSQEDKIFAADMTDLAGNDINIMTAASLEEFMDILTGSAMMIGGFYQNMMLAVAANIPVIPVTTGNNAVALAALSKSYGIRSPLLYNDPKLEGSLVEAVKDMQKQSVKGKNLYDASIEDLSALALKNTANF